MKTSSLAHTRNLSAVVALSLGLLAQGAARADTIVSSLGNTADADLVGFGIDAWAASPFQTGAQAWNLSSIIFNLEMANGSALDVRLYSDSGGKPGTSLLDLNLVSAQPIGQFGAALFTPGSSFTLNPATIYWVALGNVSLTTSFSTSVLEHSGPPPFTFTGAPDAIMSYSATSGTGGGSPPAGWITPGPNVAILFEVDGEPIAVPEPATIGLFALGSVVILLCSRKRK